MSIAEHLLSSGLPEPRHAVLTKLKHPSGRIIDEGLAVYMPGPASYTGEDTLELSLHGGQTIVELALEALNEAGARLAEPGEFTRRAFANGRIDLAEAVSLLA